MIDSSNKKKEIPEMDFKWEESLENVKHKQRLLEHGSDSSALIFCVRRLDFFYISCVFTKLQNKNNTKRQKKKR